MKHLQVIEKITHQFQEIFGNDVYGRIWDAISQEDETLSINEHAEIHMQVCNNLEDM